MAVAVKRRMARPERRELIIDAAERAFRGRDPASVTFEDIADEAEISRSLVYSYFKDRTELLEAVRERSEALLRADVTKALTTAHGRLDALTAAVRVHLEFARRDRTAYHYATGETPDRTRSATEERLVHELAELFGRTEEATLIGLGIVHALRAMTSEHVLSPPDDDERAVALITAFLGGGIGGLVRARHPAQAHLAGPVRRVTAQPLPARRPFSVGSMPAAHRGITDMNDRSLTRTSAEPQRRIRGRGLRRARTTSETSRGESTDAPGTTRRRPDHGG